MDPVDVRRVDVAFQTLHPIALFQHDMRRRDLLGRQGSDFKRRESWRLGLGSHIRPQGAVDFAHRIRRNPHLVLEVTVLRLVGHVDAPPADVELPAVVDAAQPTLFIASPEQVCPAVRAILVHQPDCAIRVAESNQVLAEQTHFDRAVVWFRQVPRWQERDPVLSNKVPHQGAWSDAAELVVLFSRQHPTYS
jgi:hypothetical protein